MKNFSVFELAKHLHWIIKEEKKYSIPLEPDINVPKRKFLAVLGTQISNVHSLDKRYRVDESKFKKRAARQGKYVFSTSTIQLPRNQ